MLVINNVFICLIPFFFFANAGKLKFKEAATFMGSVMSKMKNFAGNNGGNYTAAGAVSGAAAVPLFGNVNDFVDSDERYENYFPIRIKYGASNKEYTSFKTFFQNVLNDLKAELGNDLSYCINLEDTQVEFQALQTDVIIMLIESKVSNKFITVDRCLS
uniref:Secreted protein n=1 Tax=Panagrolaimus davidi TaxID=227884 RepID=A0A914QDV7_9BILA